VWRKREVDCYENERGDLDLSGRDVRLSEVDEEVGRVRVVLTVAVRYRTLSSIRSVRRVRGG
jgi:hypothetical protein